MFGVVTFVGTSQAGTELVGDHTSGVTELHVKHAVGLPIPGSVKVAADTLAYDDIDTAEDPDWDLDYDIIYLTAATANAYDDAAPVFLTPVKKSKTALVLLDGTTVPVECTLKQQLWHHLKNGQRGDGAGEVVHIVEREDGRLLVDDIQDEPQITIDSSVQLVNGGQIQDNTGSTLLKSDDTGSVPSAMAANTAAITALEAAVAALGGALTEDDFVYDEQTGDIHIYGGGQP